MSTKPHSIPPPDRLGSDEWSDPIAITRLRWWAVLVTAAAVCLGALLWAIFGRIPISVSGFGVLIDPGAVKSILAPNSGVVEAVLVQPGQRVELGAPLVWLERNALTQSLAQAREALAAVTSANGPLLEVTERRYAAELASFDHEEELVTESHKLAVTLEQDSEREMAAMQELFTRGFSTRDNVLSAQAAAADARERVVGYEVRLQDLETQREQATQQNGQTKFTLQGQIDEARRNVERLQLQLDQERTIRAAAAGRVLDVMVTPGRTVSFGNLVATIATSEKHDNLRLLAYFPVKDGKRIAPGMRILVTPSTVKRERYGGIIGSVTHISVFPVNRDAAVGRVGSEELAHSLTGEEPVLEVDATLQPARDPSLGSAYAWSSRPPPIPVTQGTVASSRVTVEERAPITYVMPLLHTWLQGRKDDDTGPSD